MLITNMLDSNIPSTQRLWNAMRYFFNVHIFKKWRLLITLLGLGYLPIGHTAPYVVVTLKPIHSLVASIMEGVGEPHLLLPDGASPHTFHLKPSTLKQIQQADILVWVGPTLELFMVKPLQQISAKSSLITLLDIPNLKTYPLRQGRDWQTSHEDHEHSHDHGTDNRDPHVWLSIENAQIIANFLAQDLSKRDPQNAKIYQQNAKILNEKLLKLQVGLKSLLNTSQSHPFLVYHDGYQYFEKEFNLNAVGTMIVNPHVPLSAYGLKMIKDLIQKQGIHCVFRETEFNDKLIQHSLNELGINVAELDPLGARQKPGPDNYEQTLNQLGKTLSECLQPKA